MTTGRIVKRKRWTHQRINSVMASIGSYVMNTSTTVIEAIRYPVDISLNRHTI